MEQQKTSLYELTNDYSQILEILDSDELTEEEKQEFIEVEQIIKEEIQNKSINSYHFIRNQQLVLDNIDNEIKRLRELKERKTKSIERFKQYVADCLQQTNQKKLDFGIGSFNLRNSKSVEITDTNLIPKEYIKEKIEYTPNKTDIKKAIESGIEVSGATLKTNVNLVIK